LSKNEFPSELFLPLLQEANVPRYIALFRALRQSIIEGKLIAGAKLPASRPLAQSLKLSRNTVKSAFELLLAEGYIETRRGSGSFVSDSVCVAGPTANVIQNRPVTKSSAKLSNLAERLNWQSHHKVPYAKYLLEPAIPALAEFPWIKWQRAVNYAGRVMKHEMESSGLGSLQLRVQIASYLQVVRGVNCHENNILVFSGSQQAIYLSLQLLLDPGESVFVEEPCYFGIDGAVNAIGANKILIDIDQQGFNLKEEKQHQANLAVVTPSRNYPLGTTLSLQRRIALLQWAKDSGSWIIEDDYDSEFRFDGPPLTSLQGLDSAQRVIYAGTFSRILHPSIRIGYLVLPDQLVQPFSCAKALMQGNVSILPQLALAQFMAAGHFSSHVRRMRKLYHGRRNLLQELVAQYLCEYLTLVPSDGGMHCVYLLGAGYSDKVICQRARALGVGIKNLSDYYSSDNKSQGIVIGFAGFNEQQQRRAIRALESIFSEY